MRLKMLLTVLLVATATIYAHEDPVVMTIGGQPVNRSEFEYSLNKNNADLEGRITPEEYVESFADYKMVVMAAKAMEPNTPSMLTGLVALDNMQNAPGIEEKARGLYDERRESVDKEGGLFLIDDVFVHMGQRATSDERLMAKQRIGSLYVALKHGADINTLDIGNSKGDSVITTGKTSSWVSTQDMLHSVADTVRNLRVGQTSEPFLAEDGWHIISLKGKKNYPAFEEMRVGYMNLATQEALAKSVIDFEEDPISATMALQTELKNGIAKAENESAEDALNLKYDMQEPLDNYMYLAILAQEVFSKWEEDEVGLQRYFNKNKEKYRTENNKQAESLDDVRVEVINDYNAELQDEWMKSLRKKYPVVINKAVLATVNKH